MLAVVFDALQVLVDQPRERRVVKNALLPDSPFREDVQQQLAQLVPEPFRDGDAEALFPTRQDVRGQLIRHGPLEDVFRLEPLEFEAEGDRIDELDKRIVQERRPGFQRASHARPVHFHENVVLHVELAVKVNQPLHRAGGGGAVLLRIQYVIVTIDLPGIGEQAALLLRDEGPDPHLVAQLRPPAGAPQEALELEVQAEVLMRHRQQLRQRPKHALVQRPRHAVEAGGLLRGERRIPRKQFIAAVTAQRHRDVLPREPREQVSGNHRGIGEWFVQERRHLGQHVEQCPALEDVLVMIRPVELRDPPRVAGLIKRAFLEPNRKRLDLRRRSQLCHQRHHGARIDAAAEEDP